LLSGGDGLLNGIPTGLAEQQSSIAREAIGRIAVPEPVAATTVLWVAATGIAINSGTALLFFKGRLRDINIKGAFLHMAADAAVSTGVVISALTIIASGWVIVDPVVALLVSAIVAWSAFGLIKSAIHLSLDGVPQGVNRAAIEAWLRALPGVVDLHDLHIWALSTTLYALTVHLVMPDGYPNDAFFENTARELERQFGIKHTTLQIEHGGKKECQLADAARP
jgi:cobalt-zinc-cadmium efflux system protein